MHHHVACLHAVAERKAGETHTRGVTVEWLLGYLKQQLADRDRDRSDDKDGFVRDFNWLVRAPGEEGDERPSS